MQYLVSFLVLQSYFIVCLIVFLVHCECSVALPRGAVDWPAVYDCGISWSHSLTVHEGPDGI